jgi:hypothetical protein
MFGQAFFAAESVAFELHDLFNKTPRHTAPALLRKLRRETNLISCDNIEIPFYNRRILIDWHLPFNSTSITF